MGGHRAGNRASQLAINFFATNLLNNIRWAMRPDRDDEQLFTAQLKAVLVATHRAIIAESKSTAEYKGMGTTLTAAYIVWPQMWIVHAGDTRCYLYRNHQLQQLTKDHTMANQLLEQGAINPKEAIQSRWASVLWNALGADGDEVIADTHQVELAPGDRVLLCSDGLNKHLDDLAISKLLQEIRDPESACQSLIDQANSLGGTDNITAIVANYGPYVEPQLVTSIVPSIEHEKIWEDLSRFGAANDTTGIWPHNAMNNPETRSSNTSQKTN
jgi:protein phosphatase